MYRKSACLTKYEWGFTFFMYLWILFFFFFSALGQPLNSSELNRIKWEPSSKQSNEIHDSFTMRDPEINFHEDIK